MIPIERPIIRVLIFTIILFGFTHISAAAVTPAVEPGKPGLSYRYVETFGKTGVPFTTDASHLFSPEGVDVDVDGNLWVAETLGGRAMQFNSTGSLLMSIGQAGSIETNEYDFCEPSEAATDNTGNIWVVDRCAARVVKYDSDGNYLDQLGTGESGTDNDQFGFPIGIAFDSHDNIYVSDEFNHRVQVFDSSGTYSTTIGLTDDPGPGNAQLRNPYRMAIDVDDRLYVADMYNNRVQIFDAGHTYLATLGVSGETGDCGDPSDYDHLCEPRGVAVDDSHIYVADAIGNRVRIYERASFAHQATLNGSVSGEADFYWPGDVAVDQGGNIFVADTYNHRVQMFDSSLAYVRTFGTTRVPYLTDGYHFNGPISVAVNAAGEIGLVEPSGHRLILLDASGEPLSVIGEAGIPGGDNEHFSNPQGVTFGPDGNIYVADAWNPRIQIFGPDGSYLDTISFTQGSGDYQFNEPRKVAVDFNGNLYVSDYFNHRVQIYDSNLTYVKTLGVTGEPGSDNDHFNYPGDVKVDASGNIYVVDTENHRVQKFNSSYVWQMTLGVTGECGDDFEHFCNPFGMAVDGLGRIFVADSGNARIQVFDASGAYLTTVGGDYDDGNGDLRYPNGVDVDSRGNLYIADTNNHRIQKFAPGVPGWRQANINGFGDRQNGAIFSLASYNGELFAGTANESGNGAQLWSSSDGKTWSSIMVDGFGNTSNRGIDHLLEYNGYLYAGTWADEVNGGEVWRSQNGRDWSLVASGGFDNVTNSEVHHFVAFKDQLYATTWSSTDSHGTELWRSSTGNPGSWSKVAFNGFNNDANNAVALSLHVFNGYLYAGTWNTTTGGEVWRSSNGTTWTQVNVDGFGTADNLGVSALTDFNGYLYAATRGTPGIVGDQIWRCQVCDVSDWVKVVDNGFENNETSDSAALQVVNGFLFLAAGNQSTGIEVWRTMNGTDWDQVGFAGFGDSNNCQPYWGNSIGVFKDRLFIGVANWANGGEIWMYNGYPVYLPFMVQNFK